MQKTKKNLVNERFNRTITEKIFKYYSANNTRKFLDVLDLLVDQYNSRIHSAIKMTPKEVSRKQNENKVWRNLYSQFDGQILISTFSIGDSVRIPKKGKYLIKDTLKDGRKRFSQFVIFN